MDSIKIKTPIGEYLAQAGKEGIEVFIPYDKELHASLELSAKKSIQNKDLISLDSQIEQYFTGKRKSFKLKLAPQGTDFQKQVWSSLIQIPYAQKASYQDIASQLNNVKACRAVGSANGKNPIHIIIPCHRIIRKDGSLGGYAAGIEKKIKLLDLEAKS